MTDTEQAFRAFKAQTANRVSEQRDSARAETHELLKGITPHRTHAEQAREALQFAEAWGITDHIHSVY